jgi:hypothetical protein
MKLKKYFMNIKFVLYILLFLLFSAVVCWLFVFAFTIQNIVVVGNNIHVQVNQARLPKTLVMFPAAAIRGQLLKDNPILADIQFQKKYPHTLVIIPTLRTPVARLSIGTRDVLIDQSGIVLSDVDGSLPQLLHMSIPIPAVRIGETLTDARVVTALAFLNGTRDFLPIQTITIEDDSSLRAKSNTMDILFPQDGSMPAILATLQTLLSGFRIKGTLPTLIDLRFNKPMVKF